MLSIFLTKSPTVTIRSRSIGKFSSGSIVTGFGAKSRRKVLQASLGVPLIIMPQLPHTAIRHDQRNARLPSSVALISCSACSTDMSSVYGTWKDPNDGALSLDGQ